MQVQTQEERQDVLSGLREDLRRTFQTLESEATANVLEQLYQSRLEVYLQASQRLDAAQVQIRDMQSAAAGRAARQLADPRLAGKVGEQRDKRLAARENVRRLLQRPGQ